MTITEIVDSIEELPPDEQGPCHHRSCTDRARYVFIGPEYELCARHLFEYLGHSSN